VEFVLWRFNHYQGYGIGDKVNYEERIIGNETFKTEFTYDAFDRVKTKKYPNNTRVEYAYNSNDGELQSIGRPGTFYNTPLGQQPAYLYSVVDKNVFGLTTAAGYQSQFVNGPVGLLPFTFNESVAYNSYGILQGKKLLKQSSNGAPSLIVSNYAYNFQSATGNLLQRKDLKYNLQEDFTYDNVNRLIGIQSQMIGSAPGTIGQWSLNYAANGNVIQKSDAGSFSYDQANRVSEISPFVNIPTDGQDITYTPFDKVSTISESINKARFSYWATGERAKMELLENDVLKKTKYYAPDFEKEVDAQTGQVRELCYIYGPDDNLVSIIEKKNGAENTYYTETDHLGSITQIFDISGVVIEEKSFDAWGRGRDPQTWSMFATTSLSNGWDRGYTAHEHLPQFGIINMNGRLYDPLLGRMMEPDPLIIGEGNSQGYNRYSYALNNPLKFTDPDGHHPLVAMAIGAAVSAAMYTGQVAFGDGGFRNWSWSGFGTSAFMGALSAGATNSIGDMFKAGTGSLTNELGRAGMHGLVGYISSSGDLRNAMVSAVGSIAGSVTSNVPLLNTHVGGLAFSMTAGGVSSSVLGGTFLEGAISAGLVHELNFQLHRGSRPDNDGHITVEEANEWYKNGNGRTLNADLSKVDLSFLTAADFDNKPGTSKFIQTLWSSKDGRVYGNIRLTYKGNNRVSCDFDRYDFEMHPWGSPKNWVRNFATMYGDPGKGKGFIIKFKGTGIIGNPQPKSINSFDRPSIHPPY
jgi:RHS repeat-associated protein